MLKDQREVFSWFSSILLCFCQTKKFPLSGTLLGMFLLKYNSESIWWWRLKNNRFSHVIFGFDIVLGSVCKSVTMMLLNITVVSIPSKLINIRLYQQFGICYPLPSLFDFIYMHWLWFTAARESGYAVWELLEVSTSGIPPVWGLFSLKRKWGKKIISQSPIFTI